MTILEKDTISINLYNFSNKIEKVTIGEADKGYKGGDVSKDNRIGSNISDKDKDNEVSTRYFKKGSI